MLQQPDAARDPLQNYESSHERLPPGVVNETGPVLDLPKGYHFGWLAQILPYFEQRNVYNHLNFKLGLYEPQNSTTRPSWSAASFAPPTPDADSRAERRCDDELRRLEPRLSRRRSRPTTTACSS